MGANPIPEGASQWTAVCVCMLLWLSCLSLPAHGEQTAADPHGGRLQFVRSLIEDSSAARRVAASASPEAKARRQKARELHHKALSAHEAGDHAGADVLLAQAARHMIEAVRLADEQGNVRGKRERDFDARLSSVEALADAHQRVCDEKNCERSARDEVRSFVDGRVAQARALREAGEAERGRALLDEAYVALKVAIEHLRGGDTLVRSLHFKNKEEEYAYELDRNNTHRMLIGLLLEDKARGTNGAAVQKFLTEASALRARAETQAAAGNYEAAIRSLEDSTRQLQQALRNAGIYIPG